MCFCLRCFSLWDPYNQCVPAMSSVFMFALKNPCCFASMMLHLVSHSHLWFFLCVWIWFACSRIYFGCLFSLRRFCICVIIKYTGPSSGSLTTQSHYKSLTLTFRIFLDLYIFKWSNDFEVYIYTYIHSTNCFPNGWFQIMTWMWPMQGEWGWNEVPNK